MKNKISNYKLTRFCLYTLLAIVLFSSCLTRGTELKHEKGFVVAKQYQAEINAIGTGVGFCSGKVVNTVHSIHEDAKFIVVFKCEHGVIFTINNDKVYAKVKEGDTVSIDYYEMLNKKGEVKDFDFIDANKCTVANPKW